MIVEAYELADAHPAIGPIFIYTLIDNAESSNDPESHFGIYHWDQTPKPAAAAIQEAIRDCVDSGDGSVTIPGPGLGDPSALGSVS